MIDVEQYYQRIKRLNIRHYADEVPYYSKALLRPVETSILETLIPRASILDLGCGSGRFSIGAAKFGFQVIGVDITPESVQAAQTRASAENLTNTQFVIGDMTELVFGNETFDYVFCPRFSINAVATIEKRRKAVAEMIRVVKPGGIVFIESFNKYYWGQGPVLPLSNLIRDISRHIRMLLCKMMQQPYAGLLPGDITYLASKVIGASEEGYAHLPTLPEIRSWIPYERKYKIFSIPQLIGKIHWDILKHYRYSIWIIININESTLVSLERSNSNKKLGG